MNGKKKLLSGAAALSVVTLASLVGVRPAAAACEPSTDGCQPPVFHTPGLANAFLKLDGLGFPGATGKIFQKEDNAFNKIQPLGFPGNTANIFKKD